MSEGAAGAELASSLQVVPGVTTEPGFKPVSAARGEPIHFGETTVKRPTQTSTQTNAGNTGRTSSCGAASGGMSDAASPGSVK